MFPPSGDQAGQLPSARTTWLEPSAYATWIRGTSASWLQNAIFSTRTQVTWNVVLAVSRVTPPIVTCKFRGFDPTAVQFPATAASSTKCSPPLTPSIVAVPFGASGRCWPSSSSTVYPSGSKSTPEVAAVTWTVPVTATQVTANVVLAVSRVVPPVVRCTVRGFSPAMVQFAAAPASLMLWSPPHQARGRGREPDAVVPSADQRIR